MTANADTSAESRIWIYYPGPGIVVTSVYIETPEARYRVRDLTGQKLRYLEAYPARRAALYCGLVELLLAGVLSVVLRSAEVLMPAGAIAGLGVAAATWTDDRRNPRLMELIARYEGRQVVLFSSDNERVFDQVRRALVRALEADRRPRP